MRAAAVVVVLAAAAGVGLGTGAIQLPGTRSTPTVAASDTPAEEAVSEAPVPPAAEETTYAPPSRAPTPEGSGPQMVGHLVSDFGGWCLSAPSTLQSGDLIELRTCDGSGEQEWTLYQGGSLSTSGWCMDAPQNINNRVQIFGCNGTPPQQFNLTSDKRLVVAETGKCLGLGSRYASATPFVQQMECTQADADLQTWSLQP